MGYYFMGHERPRAEGVTASGPEASLSYPLGPPAAPRTIDISP